MLSLGRLWRTVRWLKAEQIIGRIRLRLPRAGPDLAPSPSQRRTLGVNAPSTPDMPRWVAPPAREPNLLAPTRMRFLGETHELTEVGWDDPSLPLLWRYNQHYFDDLNAAQASQRREWHRALVERWVSENPPGRGTGWAPYPLSLRIVNWIKASLSGFALPPPAVESLAVQARWLEHRIEWHLLGNHLFANAKALVFAGLYFDGPEAERWLTAGASVLQRELPEQILADGGQFERSPMYHALALEDILDLLNLIRAQAPPASPARALAPTIEQRAGRMLHWLRCLCHPDGTLARFNDTAEGVALTVYDLERYAAALGLVAAPAPGEGVQALEPSGYLRATRSSAVALLDVAPVGPDYLPGHAHADTLSFELSVRGCELIVNRGTSVYGDGPRRQIERGTAAHSTVQIGAHDSSEVWAGFRVGRRARPRDLRIDGWHISAAHDGYAHLPAQPLHRRAWHLGLNTLTVQDRVMPPPKDAALARFHLAPGLACEREGERSWCVRRGARVLARARVEIGAPVLEAWQHAQRFGELVPATTLAVALVDGCAEVHWSWADQS
jgi:uncharacterized heparinase superfamily protein